MSPLSWQPMFQTQYMRFEKALGIELISRLSRHMQRLTVNAVSASMGTLSLKCQSGSNAELYMNRAHSLHGLKHYVFTVCCPSSPWSSAVSNIKCSVTQQRVHNIDDHKGYSH